MGHDSATSSFNAKARKNTCGCRIGTKQWKSGESRTRLGQIYNGIMQRCYNKNRIVYEDYGGRGIVMCDEWLGNFHAFKAWSLANGYADDLTIDRIDNEAGYSPENCRWASMVVQCNNSRRNVYLLAFGEKKTFAEWTRDPRCKVSYFTLVARFRSGQPAARKLAPERKPSKEQREGRPPSK